MRDNLKAGRSAVVFAALLCGGAASAQASAPLLNATEQSQLATWLGEGAIQLTKVYAKAAGDTSLDFHRAADGKGRTFSLMEATNELGQTWLIGGYNPQSWDSSGGFHITADDAQRTGFVFNLTTSTIHRQTLKNYASDSAGSFQTYNAAAWGPSFGVGNDLYVPTDLTHGGSSFLYSYAQSNFYDMQTSILDGSMYNGPNITYGALEVYTISAAVPEPQTGLMWLAGVGMLAAVARRKKAA